MNLYKLLEVQLNVTVGDGVKTYMGLHFAEDGYQDLNLDNPNYHMLLELFYAIESFLGTLKLSLKFLEKHSSHLIPTYYDNEVSVNLFLNLFWTKLDEFHEF